MLTCLFLDVDFLTLHMQQLGQQTTKLLIATLASLFYLVSVLKIRLNNICENSSEAQCLALKQ